MAYPTQVTILLLLSALLQVNSNLNDNQLGAADNNEKIGGDGLSKDLNSQVTTNPACQAEVNRICGKRTEYLQDLDALECILNQKRNEVEEISDACNNVLWHYRKNITEEAGFLKLADKSCIEDFKKTGCWMDIGRKQPGFSMVNCIIDNKDKIEKSGCQTLITRLEGVIFGDFEMIEQFAKNCEEDIIKYKCGRNDFGTVLKKLPHSQGKTIECLSEKIGNLKEECSKQILRVAELQSDDFHLDRALYFSCRSDREKFCSRIQAGNGRVYKCLLRNKLELEMTSECRDQIYRRQKLGWQDYRASGIVASCRDEIKKYKCRRGINSSDKHVRLSQILLCLENEQHKGQEIGGECLDEIKQHRKSLLDDFSVTPELLSACQVDKDKFCADKGIHGKTLHCLMAHAQKGQVDERLSDKCIVELENLLKMSDISSDWQVDPVLQKSCQRVVESSSCSKYPQNRVLDCLMTLLASESGAEVNVMTDDCEETLIQIQYFLARDFPMDSLLFEECKIDAQKICGASPDWIENSKNMEPERGPLVLSCLFRNVAGDDPTKIVSPKCAERVRDTMRQRALSVHLLPDIEDSCMEDLADLCSDKTKPGEELQCLQDHLEDLDKECRKAVTNFTELEMKNPTVDPFIWRHCREYIENKCSGDKSEDEDDVLECLIELKSEMKNKKCKVSVEHLQLLKIKEIRFTPKFKSQCQSDVVRYCNGKDMQPLTSWKVVNCLSKSIRDDIVTENTLRVSKQCRKQVRNLILAKLQLEHVAASDTKSLYNLCKNEIGMICLHVSPGAGRILECLRENSMRISTDSECHEALFRLEQETDVDHKLDLVLNSDCSMEIKLFCSDNNSPQKSNVLHCLKLSSKKEGFSDICAKTVRERIIEQGSDSRLNPRLHKACAIDLKKHCENVHPGQGRIIGCLKNIFVNVKSQNHLTDSCKDYIEEILEHAAKEDVKYDSDLYSTCRFYIDKSCHKPVTDNDKDDTDQGYTEECLKKLYRERKIEDQKCRDKVALLIQTTMLDIHVDPILNQACSLDLVRHCDGVPPGDGRLLKCLFIKLHEEQQKSVKTYFSERCRELLTTRGELFHMAGESNSFHMESLTDLVDQLQSSPHRNYFLTTGMTILGLIFIFGLCCGRATKRKTVEKNK